MLIFWLLWLPLILLINGIVVIAIIKNVKKEMTSLRNVEFVILGDSSVSYKEFVKLTNNIIDIRKKIKIQEISKSEHKDIIVDLDGKLLELQKVLLDINTGGIPNPDILTKRYIQELILKTLKIRIIFEKLNGRFLNKDKNINVLKIFKSG